MHELERKWILGQWGVRSESARERRDRITLERDLAGSPFAGQRVALRPQPFRPTAETYVASRGGPLPYMLRLRAIAEETAAHEEALGQIRDELASRCQGDEAGFARRWRRIASRWNFVAVNELIEKHNRYYPIEARLPMDPRTRDFALVNGEPYRRNFLDRAWILQRFPATLGVLEYSNGGAKLDGLLTLS